MKPILLLISYLLFTVHVQSQTERVKTIHGRVVDQNDVTRTPGFNTDCDTIYSFPTEDHYHVGLTFDGTHLYSIGLLSPMIYIYTLDGQLTDSIPYPGPDLPGEGGGDIDFDGTNLWMVLEQQGKIIKLNLSNGDTTSFRLPSSHAGEHDHFGCAYENGYLWITEYGDKTLMRINATTGALVDSFFINRKILPLKIIKGDLYGIEFLEPFGNFQLIRFDKSTGVAQDSFPWCLLVPLGLTWVEDHVWGLGSGFGIGTSRIYEMDLMTSTDHTMTSNRSVSVFPNPATHQVKVSSTETIQLIELFAVTGEIVLTLPGTNQTIPYDIDLSGFQKGIYFIRIFDRFGYIVEKIVIQ